MSVFACVVCVCFLNGTKRKEKRADVDVDRRGLK